MNERESDPMRYDIALRCTYDELYEMNVTRDTYRIIYHVPGKYVIPFESGGLHAAVEKMSREMVLAGDAPRFLEFFNFTALRERLRGRDCVSAEFRKLRQSGKYKWAMFLVIPLRESADELFLCYVQDIDEKKRAQELESQNELLRQRQQDAQRYQIIVERTNTIVLEWNSEPENFYYSQAALQFTFMSHLQHRLSRAFLPRRDVHPDDWAAVRGAVRRLVRGADDIEMTARLLRCDGSWLWCRCTATVVRREDGRVRRLIVTLNDTDAFMKAQRALAYRAEYDPLTGYANFDKFKRDARMLMSRRGGQKYALWYSDLKNFKYINDIYGYDAGDRILRYWADVIHRGLHEGETFARISADNYTSLTTYEDRTEIDRRFLTMQKELQRFEGLRSRKFPVELVSGVYRIERDTDVLSIEDMIDRANMAQKSVKQQPGSHLAVYTEEMRSRVILEKTMEADMERALKAGEFCVYLQGQVDIQHGNRISGAEALVRWKRLGQELIPPSDFIPLFEKNGFIVELDRYVFESICRYVRWRLSEGLPLFKVAVNVSRLTLLQPDFLARYEAFKNAYGVPDALLELECTETVLIENLAEIGKVIQCLRQKGFLLGMDDFGSGYSSLNVLKDVEVDILKLDMAFFQNGLTRERDRAIVSSIIAMAGTLDMRVVAEGVEAPEQVAFLRRIGCDLVQGYVFCRPVPMESFKPETVFGTQTQTLPDTAGGARDDMEMQALSLMANGVTGTVVQMQNDGDATLCSMTGEMETLTGYSINELHERFDNAFARLIIPEDSEHAGRTRQMLRRGEQRVHLEYRIRRKDGRMRWISESSFPGPAGSDSCFSMLIDISSVKELKAAARQNALRLQMILDNMVEGVCIFELRENIRPVYMNKAYYRMFGYGEKEYWQERAWDVLANVHPTDAQEMMERLRRAALTHETFEFHYRLRKRSGVLGYICMRASELSGEDNCYPVFLAVLADETELYSAKMQLDAALEQQNALLDNLPGGIAVFEVAETLRTSYVSNGICHMCGHSRAECDKYPGGLAAILFPESRKGLDEKIRDALSSDKQFEYVFPARQDKKTIWIMARGRLIERKPGNYPQLYTVMLDVTAWKEAELALKIQAERYRLLEETLQETFFEYDVSTDVMQITYRDQDKVKHIAIQKFQDVWKKCPRVPPVYDSLQKKRFAETCQCAQRGTFDIPLRGDNGEYRWHRVILSSIAGEHGEVVHVVGRMFDVHKDVLERMAAEERAMRDQMTGLYNKMSGEMEVRRKLYQGKTGVVTLLMIDLDNFKHINDTFGHTFGDDVLRKAADFLREIFPREAILIRFGGDEFLAFLEPGEWDGEVYAKQFLEKLSGWVNGKCRVECSIGLVHSLERDFGKLFALADKAMYRAKQKGKNCCVLCDADV